MDRRIIILGLFLLTSLGCSRTRTNLAQCNAGKERLAVEVETLRIENEQLQAERRSQSHRLAEAEKLLAEYAEQGRQDEQPKQNWSPSRMLAEPYVVRPQDAVTEQLDRPLPDKQWRAK